MLIKVDAFGLNYADVMARKGMYRDAPPLPSVLGYDVVGTVVALGTGVSQHLLNKQVAAVTEFGGYAEYAVTRADAVVELPFDMPPHAAVALTTQYATSYYSAYQLANVQEGEHVLIQAAAGGVGLALIQLCRLKNCTMYGTVSNEKKAEVVRAMGVHHVLNTSNQNMNDELRKLEKKLDVIFDSVGGKGVRLGYKALKAGGRLVTLGGAQLTEGTGILNMIRFGLSVGFYSPIQLLTQSKSILGVNMLKLMQGNPGALQTVLLALTTLLREKKIDVPAGETFGIDELFQAHMHLQSRKSIGKVAVKW